VKDVAILYVASSVAPELAFAKLALDIYGTLTKVPELLTKVPDLAGTADPTNSYVDFNFADSGGAGGNNLDLIVAPSATSFVIPAGGISPGPAADPVISTKGQEFITLLGGGQTVVVTPSVSGTIVIDGSNGSNGTVVFEGNYGSFNVKLIGGVSSNYTGAIVTEGSLDAVAQNVSSIVFNDATVTFDSAGNPIVSPSGSRLANTGRLSYLQQSQTPAIISGFNQNPNYDPLHGDKVQFAGATTPATASNFIAAPDVVSSYQDAVALATTLLQQYRYVAVAYDQGTADTTGALQPGQNFLLLFADTVGNHQVGAVARLVGLNSVDQISFSDIATPATVLGGQTFTVSSGQTSNGLTVLSGGLVDVASGGIASGTIFSGGSELVIRGGVDRDATVSTGLQLVLGSALGATLRAGATQVVSSGGSDSGTKVNGGFEVLYGAASGTIVNGGGFDVVVSGAVDSGATVNSGGTQLVPGSAVGATLNPVEPKSSLRAGTRAAPRSMAALKSFTARRAA